MKKILFMITMAFGIMFTGLSSVSALPPNEGFFGNKDECYYRFNSTTGAFVIERAPNNNICRLETGNSIVWNSFAKDIQSFEIKQGVQAPKDISKYFMGLTKVKVLDVNNLDVSSVTIMSDAFKDVAKDATEPLSELNISSWNTSKVTDMSGMFSANIKSLKLGNEFNTSKVTNFNSMFRNSAFEELILNFDTSNISSIETNSMFRGATRLKKLDISSFEMPVLGSWDGMFEDVGVDAKEGTEIILNSTFERLASSEFADYQFPYDFYTINGGDAFNLMSLNNQIAKTTGKASLIPVFPFQIHDGSGISYNKYNHRTGAKIDTSKIKNITPKDGFRLVKWTDTQDGENATIEIPAGGQSTSTYADFYNTKNVLNFGITLYAQWEREYKILKGANQTYIIGSNKDVVIKTDGDLSHLGKIQFDGNDLDVNDYDVASGSTILTLKSSFLNKLKPGVHTVTLLYSGGTTSTTGSVSTKLTILNASINNNKNNQKQGNITNPNTGDNISVYIWAVLVSVTGLISGIIYLSRNKLKTFFLK